MSLIVSLIHKVKLPSTSGLLDDKLYIMKTICISIVIPSYFVFFTFTGFTWATKQNVNRVTVWKTWFARLSNYDGFISKKNGHLDPDHEQPRSYGVPCPSTKAIRYQA